MESVSCFLGTPGGHGFTDVGIWWLERGAGTGEGFLNLPSRAVLSPPNNMYSTHLSVHTSPPKHAPEGCWEKTALLGQNPPHSRLCTVSTPLIASSFSAQKFSKFDVAPLIVLLLTPEFLKRFYLCMRVLYLCQMRVSGPLIDGCELPCGHWELN